MFWEFHLRSCQVIFFLIRLLWMTYKILVFWYADMQICLCKVCFEFSLCCLCWSLWGFASALSHFQTRMPLYKKILSLFYTKFMFSLNNIMPMISQRVVFPLGFVHKFQLNPCFRVLYKTHSTIFRKTKFRICKSAH